jgi:hypothetical protein
VLYLHIFGNIIRFFSLKPNAISKIAVELTKNIHPEPLKRTSLEKLLMDVEKIFNDEKDWSFVNELQMNQMAYFYDSLDK